MTGHEIAQKVKELNLPQGSYVVFGSCPLALAGIRPTDDIDLFITPELFETLQTNGWQQFQKGSSQALASEHFEAYDNWDFGSFQPTVSDLLSQANDVDGIPFVSLPDVLAWKKAAGRPKDVADVELIEAYLAKETA